jgi:hypothetical protein
MSHFPPQCGGVGGNTEWTGTRIKGREGMDERVENVRGHERENATSDQRTFKGACRMRSKTSKGGGYGT